MALWGNNDNAGESPKYANTTLSSTKNQTELFGNVTPDDVIAGATVGVFGVSDAEMNDKSNPASEAGAVAHSGWVIRTEGTGGRAGRVNYEVLVAGGIQGDTDTDDTVLPE